MSSNRIRQCHIKVNELPAYKVCQSALNFRFYSTNNGFICFRRVCSSFTTSILAINIIEFLTSLRINSGIFICIYRIVRLSYSVDKRSANHFILVTIQFQQRISVMTDVESSSPCPVFILNVS